MNFCHRCGAALQTTYRQVGFDSWGGWPVYQARYRCPNANQWGWPTLHADREEGRPQRADWFGHTDASILQEPSPVASEESPT